MPENGFPVEDKALFVRRLNEALIECGAGRYGSLRRDPMEYFEAEGREYVRRGHQTVSVTYDSLPAMMHDIWAAGIV